MTEPRLIVTPSHWRSLAEQKPPPDVELEIAILEGGRIIETLVEAVRGTETG